MVQFCVVPKCRNNARTPGVSFFSFPKDKSLRKSWVIKIRRDDRKCAEISDTMRVCSAHFEEQDIILSKNGKRRLLKKDALPTIFTFTSPRKLKKRRIIKKHLSQASTSAKLSQEILDSEESDQPEPEVPEELEPGQLSPTEPEELDPNKLLIKNLIDKLTAAENRNEEFKNRIHALTMQLQDCIKENAELKNKVEELESHKCNTFSLDAVKKDKELIKYYTGFDNEGMLDGFLEFINPDEEMSFSKKLAYKDQVLIVLSKLRQGFDNIDLAYRINVSSKHISKVFVNWINITYYRLSCLNIWPHRNVILDNSPASFKEKYPDTFLLLDCTEIKIECPSDLVLQSQSYSTYKSHNTMKGLVGCDPNGGLLFVSSLFTGSISDKKIVEMSGLLKVLEEKLKVGDILPNDSVMFDKGFNISSEIQSLGLNFNVPPLATQLQFSEDDVLETRKIASCRVHVERLIRRIKTYKILSNVLPIIMMPHLNQVWTVCCLLTGFRTITKPCGTM